MKKIAFLFLLFCNSIHTRIAEYLDDPESCFEIVLNEIAKIAVPSNSTFEGNSYALSNDEFCNLRAMIVELLFCVRSDESKLASLIIITKKLHHAVIGNFPIDRIQGYVEFQEQNQQRVRSIAAMFNCALYDAIVLTFNDKFEHEFLVNYLFFKNKFQKSVKAECKKHNNPYYNVESILVISSINVAHAKVLGDKEELQGALSDGWCSEFVVARCLLNDIISVISKVQEAEVDDILSKKIVAFIVTDYNAANALQIINAMIEMLYKKIKLQGYIKNSVEVYLVSLSVIFRCIFQVLRMPSSYKTLKRFVLEESRRYKKHYDRISYVLKKSFKLLKVKNFKNDNNVSFFEIRENYEEYMEKLDGEILDVYQADQVLNSLGIGGISGVMGFVLSCTIMHDASLQKCLQAMGVFSIAGATLGYAVLRGR